MSDAPDAGLRIVRGAPTPEELAAVTAVVAAAAATGAAERPRPVRSRRRWNDPAVRQYRLWPHGPGGWRAAAR